VFATDAATAASTWRPQEFGDRRASDIEDPIVEPLWTGPRVLALVDERGVRMTDVHGAEVTGLDEIERGLTEAAAGTTLLLEAYLTPEPIQEPTAIARRDEPRLPAPGQAMTQMVFGQRADRKTRLIESADEAQKRSIEAADGEVAFVAVDLLWIDADPLLDVPLLERKRLLESAVPESRLIRVGIHIRPPIDTWLGSWRTFGFNRIAFKAANSRYLPGAKNTDWAVARIPTR
jgi:hypothetical protein